MCVAMYTPLISSPNVGLCEHSSKHTAKAKELLSKQNRFKKGKQNICLYIYWDVALFTCMRSFKNKQKLETNKINGKTFCHHKWYGCIILEATPWCSVSVPFLQNLGMLLFQQGKKRKKKTVGLHLKMEYSKSAIMNQWALLVFHIARNTNRRLTR